MGMMKQVAFGVVGVSVGLYLFACSTSDPSAGSASSNVTSEKPKKKETSSTKDESTPTPAATAAKGAGTGATCGAKTTFDDCASCCVGTTTKNAGDDAFDACICNSAKKKCSAQEAAMWCQPPGQSGADYDSEVGACEPDFDTCGAEADKACAADPACAAVASCFAAAKCETKDGADGGLDNTTEAPTANGGK